MGKTFSLFRLNHKMKKDDAKPLVMKFVFVGLASAGKTSMLLKLKNGEMPEYPYATIGIDFQLFLIDGVKYQGWDIASRERSRSITISYLRGASGFIFVVDAARPDEIDRSLCLLNEELLQREITQETVVMVVANKQDLDDAISAEQLEERIRKQCTLGMAITVFVMPCSVLSGEGLQTGFDTFLRLMHKKKAGQLAPGLMYRAWETLVEIPADKGDRNDDQQVDRVLGVELGMENDGNKNEEGIDFEIKSKDTDNRSSISSNITSLPTVEERGANIVDSDIISKGDEWNASAEIKTRMEGFVH